VGNLLTWLKSYISGRKQYVVLGNSVSEILQNNAGVPQGSVLGPLLFLIFINDIQDIIKTNLRQFADDASTYYIYNIFSEVSDNLLPDLESLLRWSNRWFMDFNTSKTEGLNICFTTQDTTSIKIDGFEIKDVECHKHLGLILNKKATWSDHIKSIHSKAIVRIGILRSFKYKFDRTTLETLYISFIRPTMEYASCVWDNCTLRDSQLLESLQTEAARICTGLPKYCSLKRLYTEIGWSTLDNRRTVRKLIMTYKLFNNLDPNIRASLSLEQFIFKIKKKFNAKSPPKWFLHGERKLNILYCRLRNNCSTLKSHLFSCNLETDSTCSCGYSNKDTSHYFLECPKYINQRRRLLSFMQSNNYDISLDLMLCGSNTLSYAKNIEIVDNVLLFIKDTARF